MKLRLPKYAIVAIAVGILLGGCSGHNSVVPSRSSPSGRTVILSGSINGTGPQLFADKRRPAALRHPLATFSTITVSGTIFEGDVGFNTLKNAIAMTCPCANPLTASVPFSNVPVGNNQFAILSFTGNAADGSNFALGELAGAINVTGSTTNTATLTETTTQDFQIIVSALANGELGTSNLASSTLSSTVHSAIVATGQVPNSTTHLYTPDQVKAILFGIDKKFESDVVVNVSPPTNGSLVFVRDWTNSQELNLSSNVFVLSQLLTSGSGTGGFSGGPPIIGGSGGGDFFASVPQHTADTNPGPVPFFVNSFGLAAPSATTHVASAYPGHMLVGATNNRFDGSPPALPFNGGFASVDVPAGPGTFTFTVPTGSTQKAITVMDNAAFAFGVPFFESQPPFTLFFEQNSFVDNPLSETFWSTNEFTQPRIFIHTPYNATPPDNQITVDTFSNWNIPLNDIVVSPGGNIVSYPLNGTTTFTVQRPFSDGGNDLLFNNWKTGGTNTGITQGASGYVVTTSGIGTGTLTTTTPWFFLGRQNVIIFGNGSPFSPGSVWTLKATDMSSVAHQNSGIAGPSGFVTIPMGSIENITDMKSVEIDTPTTGLNFTILNVKNSGV